MASGAVARPTSEYRFTDGRWPALRAMRSHSNADRAPVTARLGLDVQAHKQGTPVDRHREPKQGGRRQVIHDDRGHSRQRR